MLHAALAAIETRDPAARLAELVRESLHAGATGSTRHLDYSSGDLHVHLEVTGIGAGPLTISVELLPPHDCAVEVRHPGGALSAAAVHGRCLVRNVESGPVRLTFEGPDGKDPERTQTTWVSL